MYKDEKDDEELDKEVENVRQWFSILKDADDYSESRLELALREVAKSILKRERSK